MQVIDDRYREKLVKDAEQAIELRIKHTTIIHIVQDIADFTRPIYPDELGPLGILNSMPEVFDNLREDERTAPELTENMIITQNDKDKGIHFYYRENKEENYCLIRVYCIIRDIAIKLQLRNFYQYIKNHNIIGKFFESNILEHIEIARLDEDLRELTAEIKLPPLKLRTIIENIITENTRYAIELGDDYRIRYNRSIIEEIREKMIQEEDIEPKERKIAAIILRLDEIEKIQTQAVSEKLELIKMKKELLDEVVILQEEVDKKKEADNEKYEPPKKKTAVERLHEEIRKRKEIFIDDDDN